MIELIFAIVIIGITLMSAPMLISQAAKSGYVTIQQEAISEAASQVNMIMGYYWDESITDKTCVDPILHVSHGSDDLDMNETVRRLGTPEKGSRTFRCGSDEFDASTAFGISADGDTLMDDIDDFDGNLTHLEEIQISTADNIEKTTIDISTVISYSTDGTVEGEYQHSTITYIPFNDALNGSTNIKSITVTLTSSSGMDELNKKIILRAFSCNNGGFSPEPIQKIP